MTAELDNEQLRAAAREVLDIFGQGDTSEALHSAMAKLRSAAGIAGRTYDTEEELEPLYRTLTGSGLTRRQLFWGAAPRGGCTVAAATDVQSNSKITAQPPKIAKART